MRMLSPKNRFLALALCLGSFCLTACKEAEKGPSSFEVWSTYSTQKVIHGATRNEDFTHLGEGVKIQMMRDEQESGQLILTPEERAVFDLRKSELICRENGKKIPAKNISIYVQKYISLEILKHAPAANGLFNVGEEVPDMLLPMEYAISSGENVVEKGNNQGFTIEIDSTGIKAGTYKGEFTLVVNQVEKQIPIEVVVWDIALEGKSTFQTCWLIYSMYMLTGEYDSTKHMLNTYADFLSRYKANPYVIQDSAMNSPEAFMQDVERMWPIKNYNSIIIPYDFPLSYQADSEEGEKAASYVVKLAEKSTEENFYLDYALFYPSTYDEADAITGKKDASPAFFKEGGNYQLTLEKAIDILERKGYFAKHDSAWNARVKKAIRAIPDVFTNVGYSEQWVEEWPATFCPKINVVDSQKIQEVYKDYSRKNANGNLWTYTCLDPNYPYPSNHLDDDNLSMRVMGWMEKAFGMNGYLFFMANMYTTEFDKSIYTTPYTVADRNNGANGDGFIMYPGRAYGSPEPFPSTRLVTYRDGLEDFDMLEVYHRKISALAEKYHLENIDFSRYVSDLYSSLFKGAAPTESHEALCEARERLSERILSFDNEDELLTYEDIIDGAKLHIYCTSESLSVNGVSLNKETISNGRYHYVYPLQESGKVLKLQTANKEYSVSSNGYLNATHLESGATVTVSEESSFEKAGDALHLTIASVQKESAIDTLSFTPTISLKGVNLAGAKRLMFRYANPSAIENLAFDVEAVLPGRTVTLGGHYCTKGGEKTAILDISKIKTDLSKTTELRFVFPNYYFTEAGDLMLYQPRDMVLHDVFIRY